MPAANWPPSPAAAGWPPRPGISGEPRRWSGDPSTAGTASGSCAPTTTSAPRSARRSARKARSSSSRTASACWPASAWRTAGEKRDGRRGQASGHQARHRGAAAGLLRYYLNLGEISSYPPGYKENAGIFCHVNPWVMIGERGWATAMARTTTTAASIPRRARRSATASLRAVCLRADDRGQGCAHLRRGQELLAHRHGGVELLRHRAVDSGHSHFARRLEIAPVIPEELAGIHRDSQLSRRGLQDLHRAQGRGQSIALTVDGKPIEGNVVPRAHRMGARKL
jgi:hypothetical protein